MSIHQRLQALNIKLPPVSVPAAAYLPYVQTGNLVFISGHIAKKDGMEPHSLIDTSGLNLSPPSEL